MQGFLSKQLGLLFSVLIIPLLYAIGYSYDLGYLNQYNIDIQMFHSSIDHYFIIAFYAFSNVVISIFPYFNKWDIMLLCAVFAVIFYLILWSIQFNAEGKIISWQNNFIRGTNSKFLFISISISTLFIALLFVFFICIFLLISLPVMSYKEGKNDAKQEITNYRSCEEINTKLKGCVFITQEGKPIAKGRLVTSSEKYVAVFDGTQTRVIPIESKEINIVVK